jgi:hypothetical protein
MAAADLPGTDEERAEAALIAAAGNILRSENREVPEDFVAALFAYAVPEDLMRYDPRQLAELAAKASSTSISSVSRRKRAGPRSSRRSSACSSTCASAFRTGGR